MIKTVTLETAKVLKENGFKQDATFYWYPRYEWIRDADQKRIIFRDGKLLDWNIFSIYHDSSDYNFSEREIKERIAASTTDELLEVLPRLIIHNNYACQLWITRSSKWIVYYASSKEWLHELANESLPEALAQMWLWLRKEGLI